ncbi:unnamed protein product [Trichobilharzia szidati]|nr:unnamed protein product [Trichobilharzia szidati]
MKSQQTQSKSSTAQVIVNVIDTNDHFPRIRILSPTGSKTLEIIEESPPGQDIGILDVSDGDTGKNAEVNCNLTNQTIIGVLSLIPMNNEIIGKEMALANRKYKITLEKRIDREEYPSIEVTILCQDSGIPRLTSTLTQSIKIIDVNDHDPIAEQNVYMIEVTEDSDPQRSKDNFELITIHATDKDEGQNAKLHFALDEETPVHLLNVVTVDSNSGVLRTLGNLDREQLNAFSVTVVCADHGEPQRMTKVFINVRVLDYNDNSPAFSQPYFEFLLKENNPVGQLIGYFEVTDKDIGENAELEIYIEENLERSQVHLTALNNNLKLSSDVKQLRFNSGGLVSSSGIRQRKYTDYSSKFKLSYQKRPRTNISSSVSGPTLYDIQLYAESIIDRESLFLRDAAVFPPDILPNYEPFDSSTTTTTTTHNNNNLYKYTELSKVSSQTNYSTITPTIFLLIRAQDKGIPKLSEHVTIRVHILDDNDNSPRFLYPDSYSINKTKVYLSYKEPVDYAFTQIQAVDDDAGENGTINYFIHSGNNEGYFKLNKHSGVLSVNKEISYSAIGEHTLRIEARDGGQPYRFTMAELIIEIDQSASKAYLNMDAYNFNGFSGLFNFGASGYTLNFYIIVGIITSACIISTVLITFVFVFLRKNKQQRNFRHVPIAIDRNGNSNNINNNNNNINHGETNMTNSPLSWQKVDQLNSYEFGTIPGGYGVIQPLPDCLSQFSANGGNSSLQLLNYPNGSIYSSPNTRNFHMDRRNSPDYFTYMDNRNNYSVDNCNTTTNNNNSNINRTNYCNYSIDNNISSNDTNHYNDTLGSRKIKIFIPRSHHDTMNVISTTHDESICTDFKYPYKACSNYFDTEMQQTVNPIQSYPARLNN